jgi:heme/copper-type cytochrome/quinol oxidase subunit 1
MAGGLFTVAALLAGGVDTGWTFYTPFSTMFSNTNVILVVVGVFITGFSSILTGLNFIVTVHALRILRHDLVPITAVRVVDVCRQPRHGARNPGARDDAGTHRPRAPGARGYF